VVSREIIKSLLSLVRFLANPRDVVSFFSIISSDIFGMPMEEVAMIMKKARYDNANLFGLLNGNGQGSLFDSSDSRGKLHNILKELLEYSRSSGVSDVIGRFLEKTGLLKSLCANETPENIQKIEDISAFGKLLARFQGVYGDRRVGEFVEYIDYLEFSRENTQEQKLDPEAVKILTVHGSKGLEFDAVFIPSLVAQRFPSTDRSEAIGIPEELIKESIPAEEDHMQEERRLFYVAATRAKKHLFLTLSERYKEGKKKWKQSVFVTEAIESKVVSVHDHKGEKEPERSIQSVQAVKKVPDVKRNIVLKKASYSQIYTYLECPLKYKFRYLFQVPSPPQATTSFGSSVHNALKNFYEILLEDRSLIPTLEGLQSLYKKNWISQGYDTRTFEQAMYKRGQEMIERFFEENKNNWVVPAFVEKMFTLRIAECSITGRIDRIDKLEDGTYEVIDYKTGKLKDEKEVKKDLQLSLYALACRDFLKIPVSRLSLYFLEDNKKISTERTEEDINKFEDELKGYLDDITESDFIATPGRHCSWCEYMTICTKAVILK
ncbi:MAG: PD-(D/E)XK nuclease family protein, partial [Patescibacteria group bacterium]